MSDPIIVAREGHMDKDGNLVTERVEVQVFDAEGWAGHGVAKDEETAERLAWQNVEYRKKESERRKEHARQQRQALLEELRG